MTDRNEWEGGVGRAWAAEWQRTDRSFSRLTPHLFDAIRRMPGSSVVDIGCGAGELSLAVAADRPDTKVLGIDISADLVATASIRGQLQPNCAFALADAGSWTPDRGAPDLYVSRHGVMFFADPVAAFGHLAGVAKDGARLCFSCFRAPRENPWASGIAGLLPQTGGVPADPHAPGPFAFADRERVGGILAAAGWADADFQPLDFDYIAGSGEDPVAEALALFARIGPAARAMRELPEAERPGFQARLRDFGAEHRQGDTVSFPAAAWIVTARKA